MLVWGLSVPALIYLPANTPGKARKDSSGIVPLPWKVGDVGGVHGSWLQPGAGLAVTMFWGNGLTDGQSIFVSSFLSVLNLLNECIYSGIRFLKYSVVVWYMCTICYFKVILASISTTINIWYNVLEWTLWCNSLTHHLGCLYPIWECWFKGWVLCFWSSSLLTCLERQQIIAQVLKFLAHMWEIQMQFQTPGFILA